MYVPFKKVLMEHSTVSTAITPRDKNSTITLVLIGIVIILCLGFIVVIIGYVGLTTGTNTPANTTNTVSNTTTPLVAQEPEVTILGPQENDIVNGEIAVNGFATYQFTNLKVEVYDNEDNKLGSSTVSISSASDSINAWQTTVDIIQSPLTTSGKIVVSSIEPEIIVSTDISFEVYSDMPENLIIYTPLQNQIMFSNNLTIKGEAKGLYEGTLQIRLRDSVENIIYTDFITIPDQYESMREFSYEFTIDDLNTVVGGSGVWEFYYQDPMDGSEVILQSIPVRF